MKRKSARMVPANASQVIAGRVKWEVLHGDCLDVMRELPDECMHAVICDPPYGLAFMGKEWDHGVPGVPFWTEALRVAKPGAYLLAFGGTRTHHRLTCAIEDAGWEIRDCLMWLYGSGFPKSLNVAQAMDKAARGTPQGSTKGDPLKRGRGAIPQRNALAMGGKDGGAVTGLTDDYAAAYVPVTSVAKEWQGWGTALKPAWEPIILARKPLVGNVVANVQQHRTGALNIDGCRVGTEVTQTDGRRRATGSADILNRAASTEYEGESRLGRWPANVVLDEEAGARLDAQSGELANGSGVRRPKERKPATTYALSSGGLGPSEYERDGDSGGASRFFYCAKASRGEREAGLEGFEAHRVVHQAQTLNNGSGGLRNGDGLPTPTKNPHPTVKPLDLMRWLCQLVTPPGGIVLDPFMGSGTTGCAAVKLGHQFIGIDSAAEYVKIARARIAGMGLVPVRPNGLLSRVRKGGK